MSIETDKEPSLLDPLGEAYRPTNADAERVLARIQASLAIPVTQPPRTSSPSVSRASVRAGKKGLLVGLSCVAMTLAGVTAFLTTRGAPPVARAIATVESPVAPPAATELPPVPEQSPSSPAVASMSVGALPSAAAVPSTGHSTSQRTKPSRVDAGGPRAPVVAADTLEKEARLLAAARRALSGGQGDRALALLDEHAREFPDGWLASDRAAERIIVLCSLGREAEAVREARTFLDGRAKSPLTQRVEASCAGAR